MNDLNPLYKQMSSKDEDLYKISSAEDLLSEASFKHIIKDLENNIAIPKKNFEDVYITTIFKFADFIQSLPNTKYPNFGFAKGHLMLALLRAGITIRESENFPCPMVNHQYMNAEAEEKRMAIWQFIIFSSALFLDLGKTISSLYVETCNDHQENKLAWQPLEGSMTMNNNTHYTRKITSLLENSYTNKLNIVYAINIIPKHLISWIASETDLFFEWLSLLEDQAGGSGTLHKLTMVSLRKLINEYIGAHLPQNILKLIPKHIIANQEYHKNSFWKGVEHSLRGEKTPSRDTTELNHGVEFLTWLKEGIQNKSISVNEKDSKVHSSANGLFMLSPGIFLDFCKQSPKHPNWHSVYKQLQQLDVLITTPESTVFECSFPNFNPAIRRGVLINNSALIYANETTPSLSPQIEIGSLKPVPNSTLFPTPRSREDVGIAAYMRYVYNPS